MLNLSNFVKQKQHYENFFVKFTNYHYMQEFLQKLYQGTPKTLILRNLTQNQRVC